MLWQVGTELEKGMTFPSKDRDVFGEEDRGDGGL